MRVDSSQWPTANIVASVNNWHDFVTNIAIAYDKRFPWDDSNHTKLPEATDDLTIAVSDYAYLVDQQSNAILTLTGVSILQNGYYVPLKEVDRNDPGIDVSTFGQTTGVATRYDKIADNIIRLDMKPAATVTDGLKFYFQRVGSYFVAADTTKTPGIAPILHRGYVIASAYDGAMTLGLQNMQALQVERQYEEKKVEDYFKSRNNDTKGRMLPSPQSNK